MLLRKSRRKEKHFLLGQLDAFTLMSTLMKLSKNVYGLLYLFSMFFFYRHLALHAFSHVNRLFGRFSGRVVSATFPVVVYRGLESSVRWEHELSPAIQEHQGVRQGGIESLYPLLDCIAEHSRAT